MNPAAPGLPAVVVPVYNAATDLDACLASVVATAPAGSEVLVIDDASPDPAVRELLGVADEQIMILTVGGDAASKGAQEVMQALAMIDACSDPAFTGLYERRYRGPPPVPM